MKVQVKRDTKLLFFCHQKKNKQKKQLKTRQALNEIFFNLQQKCAVGALTPYFKFNPLCSFVISFSKNISTPKMAHKHLVTLPFQYFKVNLMDTSSPISLDPLELSLSQESLFDFLSHLYIQAWLGKTLKVMVLRLL